MYIMPKNSKDNLFKIKQLEVKNKLLEILKITQEKNYFTLYELDNDIETQNLILALEGDCEKYFACGEWTFFRYKKDKKGCDRPYLILIRNILSAMDIQYINKPMSHVIDNIKTSTTKYFIIL